MRIIFLSPSIHSGDKIAYLLYHDDTWIAISEIDKVDFYRNPDFNKNEHLGLDVIEEEELYQRIPFLRNKLIDEEGMFITVDYKNGNVFINPLHKTKSYFTPTYARATNQVNLKTSIWTYLYLRKFYSFKLLMCVAAFSLAIYYISWSFIIMLFWFCFFKYLHILANIDNFNFGTLNPAIVVTTMPTRIAVFTDLSKGFGSFPAIRIYKVSLPEVLNKKHEKLTVSGGYYSIEDLKYWDFFRPHPLIYATNNKEVLAEKEKQIPLVEWILLKQWAKKNKDKYYEGYYPLTNISNNWSEYEDPKFSLPEEDENPSAQLNKKRQQKLKD